MLIRGWGTGAYTGFLKGGCVREAPEKKFFAPRYGAALHPPFSYPPPFLHFSFFGPTSKKNFAPCTPTPLFAFLPFWTNFNFADTYESGTEEENLGG